MGGLRLLHEASGDGQVRKEREKKVLGASVRCCGREWREKPQAEVVVFLFKILFTLNGFFFFWWLPRALSLSVRQKGGDFVSLIPRRFGEFVSFFRNQKRTLQLLLLLKTWWQHVTRSSSYYLAFLPKLVWLSNYRSWSFLLFSRFFVFFLRLETSVSGSWLGYTTCVEAGRDLFECNCCCHIDRTGTNWNRIDTPLHICPSAPVRGGYWPAQCWISNVVCKRRHSPWYPFKAFLAFST